LVWCEAAWFYGVSQAAESGRPETTNPAGSKRWRGSRKSKTIGQSNSLVPGPEWKNSGYRFAGAGSWNFAGTDTTKNTTGRGY
jgi:hypothetical protein